MDELQRLRTGLAEGRGELLLEEVLDRLHVVVGGQLDVLDALRVGGRELRRQAVHRLRLRGGEAALGDALLGGERLEPGALDDYAPVDETVFGEDSAKFGALVAVAPVDRADCHQFFVVHG